MLPRVVENLRLFEDERFRPLPEVAAASVCHALNRVEGGRVEGGVGRVERRLARVVGLPKRGVAAGGGRRRE